MQPYYERDGITIYHGDALAVLASLPAECADLVFTSPPYNLGNTTGGGEPAARCVRGHYSPDSSFGQRGGLAVGKWRRASLVGGLADGYGAHDDAMPHEAYVAWQHEVLRGCWRLLTPTGAIFYNHKPRILAGRLVTPLAYVPDELQGMVRQVIIWARAGGINFSPAFYLPTHEWIVIIARPGWRLTGKGASGVGDVWQVTQETNNPHPAPFPLALPLRALETTGARTVLDPFVGSGTTMVAAQLMGCQGTGIDNNAAYLDLAARRLQQSVLPMPAESLA